MLPRSKKSSTRRLGLSSKPVAHAIAVKVPITDLVTDHTACGIPRCRARSMLRRRSFRVALPVDCRNCELFPSNQMSKLPRIHSFRFRGGHLPVLRWPVWLCCVLSWSSSIANCGCNRECAQCSSQAGQFVTSRIIGPTFCALFGIWAPPIVHAIGFSVMGWSILLRGFDAE